MDGVTPARHVRLTALGTCRIFTGFPILPPCGRHLTQEFYLTEMAEDRPKATASLRLREIAHKGEGRSVRRPVRDVDRALPAEKLEERLDIAAIGIHQP